LDAVFLELRDCLEISSYLTGSWRTSDFGFTDASDVKVILKRRINCQRYLRHFPANQINDDDIELYGRNT
jgi:hypothetical protein